jgi:hypothetical protein
MEPMQLLVLPMAQTASSVPAPELVDWQARHSPEPERQREG